MNGEEDLEPRISGEVLETPGAYLHHKEDLFLEIARIAVGVQQGVAVVLQRMEGSKLASGREAGRFKKKERAYVIDPVAAFRI